MADQLHITKGGKLIETYWFYDKELEKGEYRKRDLTSTAFRHLFDICELEDGVTLRDIFLLLQTHIEIFDSVLGNWCKELVEEGLSGDGKPYTGEYDPNEIEYLELYWVLERHPIWDEKKQDFDKSIDEIRGYAFPDFHGIGWELREDKVEQWGKYDKGFRIPWSISFLSASELINVPVILRQETDIYSDTLFWDEQEPYEKFSVPIAKFDHAIYTLGHILYGILWEMSFYGGPESRDKKSQEIDEIVTDAKKRGILSS